MNLLEIDNIELVYGKTSVLNAVYFKAERGKITGILGRNGCGKTSLMRIIFGELKPRNKLIRIDYKPYLKPLYKSIPIQYLPQFDFIPTHFTLKKIFKLYKLDYSEFVKSFPSFSTFKDMKIGLLSGGEKRLIEVYVTLKSNSKIVLLDEPFSYLAPVYNQALKKLIETEKKDKIIIITDHMYKNIIEISDDLCLLKDGWSRQIKSHKELIHHGYINSL